MGKTSGRGTKGQQSRTGAPIHRGFEGGQMPLRRRLPKRGFTNIFAKDYSEINVGKLSSLAAGTAVDARTLKDLGLLSRIGRDGVKVLGVGDVSVALNLRVAKVSESARAKILAAGGTVEEVA